MITLKTLRLATAQEVFSQARDHLLSQMEKSYRPEGACLYRYDGLKCAGGCFVSEEEYNKSMEGEIWRNLVSKGIVTPVNSELISELQHIHDALSPEEWREELNCLAEQYGLEP